MTFPALNILQNELQLIKLCIKILLERIIVEMLHFHMSLVTYLNCDKTQKLINCTHSLTLSFSGETDKSKPSMLRKLLKLSISYRNQY